MTVRPIRILGDPVLRTPAKEVTVFDGRLATLVEDLLDTVAVPGRAGVAAPQIGVSLRAFAYNIDGRRGYVLNPLLEETRGEQDEEEGCLSVPDVWVLTKRAEYAAVRGIDLDGAEIILEGTGLMARCLQHEHDHLEGLLYLDRLDKARRRYAMRQIREHNIGE